MPQVLGTVYEAFRASRARNPHADFLWIAPETAANYGIEQGACSYARAAEEVERLESEYASAGLGHGQRAVLMLDNRPAFFFHWLALNALGVSVVPVNSEWRSAELEYLLGHSEACIAVVPPTRADELARAALAAGRRVSVTTPELSGLTRMQLPAPKLGQPDVDTECALLYTSGTTGRPKGCVLPNEYFLWAGTWYAQIGGCCEIRAGVERLITPLPMSHMNAMACSTMVMLLSGGCIIPLDRFHPRTWWDNVRQSRATIVHYLGVMPAMLLGAAPTDNDGQHDVRFGFGAGVSARLHAAFETRFGFPLVEAWAMTETGAGAVIIANREPRKVGTACFGKAESRIEYRIVDERGDPVPTGQPGELLVRSAGAQPQFGFFREYLKDAEATAAAWAGGYFHTGDIVQIDVEGDFHFVDRKKNVIRRSGENISAVEVEGVLLQHPAVVGVGVAAVPDEVRGDEVMACVIPREMPSDATRVSLAQELVNFCLERLAYFKAPGYIAFCAQLPLTPTEKIQRAGLKELAQSLLRNPQCVDLRGQKKRNLANGGATSWVRVWVVSAGLLMLTTLTCHAAVPHLQQQGDTAQLIVNDAPFLVLGGELGNSSASGARYMAPHWRGSTAGRHRQCLGRDLRFPRHLDSGAPAQR
jgi:acyl-CoA synthetase (AMP-forming)/AMP-acid ligase II